MRHSLNQLSTWIACGIAVVYIFEQDACSAFHSALSQRQRWQRDTFILDTGVQSQRLDRRGDEYDHRPFTAHIRRFALPEYIANREENAEPHGGLGKIVRPGIPSGHGIRRVLGDLETCAEDLFPFLANSTPDTEQLVTISGSKLRSCREAIFSLMRWFESQRKEILAPTEKNPYLPNSASQEESSRTSIKTRASIATAEPQICEVNICRPFELPNACSEATKMKMTKEKRKRCNMCKPRNEALIRKYCTKQRQREKNILYLIVGILATICGAAIILTFIRKAKGKTRGELRIGPAFSSEKGCVLPGLMSTIQKSRAVAKMSDVERNPGEVIGGGRSNNNKTTSSSGGTTIYSQSAPSRGGDLERSLSSHDCQIQNHEAQVSPLPHSDSLKLRGCAGRTSLTTPTAWDGKD
ncbi:hypothetical protein ACJ72_03093 [Emergomyces africanus]|uniref:Uncharacterized protein n=1 Tax=Emergomyces africanus TaxID=1955775 RepID=A0A1B7P0K3_9EURO|nr:hypothetical protein ACJ72_03093 [Emergomyces africanus]